MVDIRKYTRGSFDADLFSIGTTSKNQYYPFYSQFVFENVTADTYLYYKPKIKRYYNMSRYSELFETLTSVMFFRAFQFDIKDESYHVNVMKGYITDSLGKPLFMLGVTDYETSIGRDEYGSDAPDYSKFKLFIATEFITNPIYTNLWRKIDKEYVQQCHKLGIAVEFNTLDNIESFFFSNEFQLNFNSITELHNHLQNDVAPLLSQSFDYIEDDVELDDYDEGEDEELDMDYEEIPEEDGEVYTNMPPRPIDTHLGSYIATTDTSFTLGDSSITINQGDSFGSVDAIDSEGNAMDIVQGRPEPIPEVPNQYDDVEFHSSVVSLAVDSGIPEETIYSFVNTHMSQIYAEPIHRFEYDRNGIISVVSRLPSQTMFFNHDNFIRFAETGERETRGIFAQIQEASERVTDTALTINSITQSVEAALGVPESFDGEPDVPSDSAGVINVETREEAEGWGFDIIDDTEEESLSVDSVD